MNQEIRCGDYLQAIGAGRRELSFNAILPPLGRDAQGRPIPPPAPGPIRLHPDEIAGLLRPYVSIRFMDQVKTVMPLALYVALFQILILRQLVDDSWLITAGLFAVSGVEAVPAEPAADRALDRPDGDRHALRSARNRPTVPLGGRAYEKRVS
jgi:hypothetical protein